MSLFKTFVIGLILGYIRFWARIALAIHRPIIIGIAGSTGKTSTKHLLQAMLSPLAPTVVTYGNSETGVPLGILGIEIGSGGAINWLQNVLICPIKIFHLRGIRYLIVEMGTDEPVAPKNMEYLLTIVQPDIAVHLNAQPVHTQQFAAALPEAQRQLPFEQQETLIVQAIGFEDAKVITHTQASAIFNGDDPVLTNLYLPVMAHQANRDFVSFGLQANNQMTFGSYALSVAGTTFNFIYDQKPVAVDLPGYVLPQHFQGLVAAALLVCIELKLDVVTCCQNLAQLHLPKGRATVLPGIHGSAIIDSTYNASTAAVLDMLLLLETLKGQTSRPVVVVLGDMRELGDQAEIEHNKVREMVAGLADQLFTVGPLTKKYIFEPLSQAATKPAILQHFDTAVQVGEYLKNNLPEHALVLVKGSQNTIFLEEAVKMLLVDTADAAKLCRQEDYWMKRKKM
jgi:UDP-N-acetylmuramoyl-tripeptide--D-alanyl-D-alanine ligase